MTPRYHRAYDCSVDTQQWLTLIFGILSGILAMVVMFQTRLGKVFSALNDAIMVLRSDMQVMRDDIQGVKTELKQDIQAVRTDLKADIHTVKTDLKEDIHTTKIDLKQDIHHAEARLSARIDRIETEPNIDERTGAQAV